MTWLKRALHALAPVVVLAVLTFGFLYVVVPWLDVWALWRIYRGYVDAAANLTGINGYLLSAAGLVVFLPFYYGISQVLYHPFDRARRWRGIGILLVIAVGYNLFLYAVTKDTTFAFQGGQSHRYYAITPTGVHFFDRAGVDPTYGIPLQPVTVDNKRQLELLATGSFMPANPATVRFFNPLTGKAELWYYKTPEGSFEFYTLPGFHPGTGRVLLPVTEDVYAEWRKTYDAAEKKKQEEADKHRAEVDRARREAEKRKADLEERRFLADQEYRRLNPQTSTTVTVVPQPYSYGAHGFLSHAGVIFEQQAPSRNYYGGDRR